MVDSVGTDDVGAAVGMGTIIVKTGFTVSGRVAGKVGCGWTGGIVAGSGACGCVGSNGPWGFGRSGTSVCWKTGG